MSRPSSDQPGSNRPRPDAARSTGEIWHNADLIEQLKESADKLHDDGSSRGDLKLVARALRELRYAFKVFTPFRWRRKACIFGSARTEPDSADYQLAVTLGQRFAAEDWLVITGAAHGIMEAGHRGAGRTHSMGLNIMLPFEQQANPVIAGDEKLVHMKYFFTRKVMFVKECHAVICLPGGFGTQDELFEVLTLVQTGKRDLVPIVLLDHSGSNYWSGWTDWLRRELLANALISAEDLDLFRCTHNLDEAMDEVLGFYRVFHSMRYVRSQTVFRLQATPTPEHVAHWNEDFASLLKGGEFTVSAALPEERDEPELAELPRLVFPFNRRNYGQLRQLIDSINRSLADRVDTE